MSGVTARRWLLADEAIDRALASADPRVAVLGAIAHVLCESLYSDGDGLAEHVNSLTTEVNSLRYDEHGELLDRYRVSP